MHLLLQLSSDERKGFTYLWSIIAQPFAVVLINPLCWTNLGVAGRLMEKRFPRSKTSKHQMKSSFPIPFVSCRNDG
jgi:hypothetical protein